jgi:hypothetical protein
MKIELHQIPIRDVISGYKDSQEEGVTAYNGKLDIRPKYQREFVYKDKQRNAVIETIKNGFPLNVMYWVKTDEGNFEVMDGQQRTISIGQFVNNDFSIEYNGRTSYFHNLTDEEQNQILDYELMVYFCEGTDKEKLDWFKIINIAGEKLTDQELRNAVYTGPWLSDAKLKFSKTNCVAYLLSNDGGALLSKSPIRQELLETAISWISDGEIEQYMSENQHKPNATELWLYFQAVINWVRAIFPHYRSEMKGLDYGRLYKEFKDKEVDSAKLEEEITRLMLDEDVIKKSGIYEYVLSGKEKTLNLRAFSPSQRREAYERQKGICPVCKEKYEIDGMEADHIKPWHEGGKTSADNCQMLCLQDNRAKGGR